MKGIIQNEEENMTVKKEEEIIRKATLGVQNAAFWHVSQKGFPFSSSVQLLSRIRLFVTPWTAAHQASLSIINS